jgi:anthranilate synthase/aminodeoxychorismate synthase-like glutamine amidotransferase
VILLLDNQDSFVWNLALALQELGAEVDVVRSDQVTVADLERTAPRALVLSPGPGRPEQAGISIAAIRALSPRVPILGVCLGHQAIGAAFGAVVRRTAPVHGRTSPVWHDGSALFAGLANPFAACRYHSLAVDGDALPPALVPAATSDDGVLMALRHRERPVFGVQFHPESFLTGAGPALLRNFLGCVRA